MKEIILFNFLVITSAGTFYDPSTHRNWKLLDHESCGQVTSSRIIGGTDAPMNAYPWMARIGLTSAATARVTFQCGGVVLNTKTVLTAAHCVTDLPTGLRVSIIRLGEHNTRTDPDCEGDFCADPVVDIAPMEIVVPRYYNKPVFKNDIALIRLTEEIILSAFIKPICLGNKQFIRKNFIDEMSEAAGWGIYDLQKPKGSDVLQVVKLRILNNSVCASYLPPYIDIGPTQICAGGEIHKDSCGGDSGGPLMIVDEIETGPRYFLLGIVSFGAQKCGETRMPGVYTRVNTFVKWILDNLESTAYGAITVDQYDDNLLPRKFRVRYT